MACTSQRGRKRSGPGGDAAAAARSNSQESRRRRGRNHAPTVVAHVAASRKSVGLRLRPQLDAGAFASPHRCVLAAAGIQVLFLVRVLGPGSCAPRNMRKDGGYLRASLAGSSASGPACCLAAFASSFWCLPWWACVGGCAPLARSQAPRRCSRRACRRLSTCMGSVACMPFPRRRCRGTPRAILSSP